jgi:hypothetical protein
VRRITTSSRAVTEHLQKEFGGITKCPKCACDFVAPPIGARFEVLEPIETQPHPCEVSRNAERGLTPDSCIAPGIYDGIKEPGILAGTSTHALFISGSVQHGTKRVCLRVATGYIDWRGIRAV